MKNIFIIGNGFDLAHGYDTDYASFIRYLIDNDKLIEKINTREGERTIVRNPGASRATHNSIFTTNKNGLNVKYEMFIDNEFLKEIITKTNIEKWCDIEVLYYELLKTTDDPKKLNEELSLVKNELEKYLCQFNKEQNAIAEFSSFFNKMGEERDNLLLNFNYTNTFERLYKDKMKNIEVLNFHGQLNSKTNPIIFGYAPTEEETKLLIDKNDNEYLKNIKRYYYKQTNNENLLHDFINKTKVDYINVFVLGHSCGVSDRKILNEVFTNENIKSINIMYYKDYQGYFDTLVNIDRVIGNESEYGFIRNIELSSRMPQHNDEEQSLKDDFNKRLENIKNSIINERKKSMPDTSFFF